MQLLRAADGAGRGAHYCGGRWCSIFARHTGGGGGARSKKMTRHASREPAVPVGKQVAVGGGGGDVAHRSLDVQTTRGFKPPHPTCARSPFDDIFQDPGPQNIILLNLSAIRS